ncbi:protein phosphatase inhibitor 2 [Rhineura floridana]|uniref:protein phosphatase inhibitor 2 n=1 Tax=Rhineura floridana TaxID=261503 RepID=UPI002AC81C26|nr:protein phosphatase inhibitor 2 [Rhineura floridana]
MTAAALLGFLLRVRREPVLRGGLRLPLPLTAPPPAAAGDRPTGGRQAGRQEEEEEEAGGRAGRPGRPTRAAAAMEAKSSSSTGRPVKGILKNRSGSGGGGSGLGLAAAPTTAPKARPESQRGSQESARPEVQSKKSQKWDEMNILATYHPAGKDYGLMKIDEPSTPYHSMGDEEVGSDTETSAAVTADVLAKKLAAAVEGKGPKVLAQQEDSSDEEDDETELSPEELEKKRQFEMKRKIHYNEGKNIKLARQLIAKELHGEATNEEDDEDDEECDDEDDEECDDEEIRDMVELAPDPSDPLEKIAHSLEEVCSGL